MQNMCSEESPNKFCQLILHPDLLGGWTFMRESGRVGARGRVREEHHDSLDSATEALNRWREKLLDQGFSIVYIQGEELPQ